MSNVGDVSVGLPQLMKGEQQKGSQPKEALQQQQQGADRELIRPLKPLMTEQGASGEQQERKSFDRESAIFNRERTVVNRNRLVTKEQDVVSVEGQKERPRIATEGSEVRDRVDVGRVRTPQNVAPRPVVPEPTGRGGRRIDDSVDIAAIEQNSSAVRTTTQNSEPQRESQESGAIRLELQA